MSKEHLVVIDMQSDFIVDKRPKDREHKVLVITDLIRWCRKSEIPITFTMFPDEDFGTLLEELRPGYSDSVIVKTESDAFSSPDFRERVSQAETLLFVGCNLDVCVKLSVQSAVKRGYQAVLYHNALLARNSSVILTLETYLSFFPNPRVRIKNFRADK